MNEQATRDFRPAGRARRNDGQGPGSRDDVASTAPLVDGTPRKLDNTLPFMVETRFPQQLTRYAAASPALQVQYPDCGRALCTKVDPARPVWNRE